MQITPEPALKVPASAVVRPAIPLLDCSPSFPLETLEREFARANDLFDVATRRYPVRALSALDTISRRWLEKWSNAHLPEIEAIARKLDRPGAYFFSVNYEWGCTCRVAPSPDRTTARLIRVLDWRTPGLGRNVLAVRVTGNPAGEFITFTWPGYTGVLTAMAKGRFSAALNQAPMRKVVGAYYLDWTANRRRVWKMPYATPSHLLREVFEQAKTYAAAKRMLTEMPISTPAIFSLAGINPNDTCVIERTEEDVQIHEGSHVAANHWQAHGWIGHPRGLDSAGRACRMHAISPELDSKFPWLKAPILNDHTRIVMVSDAALGRLVARGYEADGPATAPLEMSV